jgi:hypothetical protein
VGENRFLYQGIKYNIFELIPKTSYVTQTLNIKYRSTIEPRAMTNNDWKSMESFIVGLGTVQTLKAN